MSASRKLYVAMAEKFKRLIPRGEAEYAQWLTMVFGTANVFANDNSGFDKIKFCKACGMTDESARRATEQGFI